MHNTLHAFYKEIQYLNSAKQDSLFGGIIDVKSNESNIKVPSFDDLLVLYEKHWINDWYIDKKQREDYYQKGLDILKTFYTIHDGKWTIPAALESWFKIMVGDYFVHGRIDRIDKKEDGTLEIIDYKTGKSKEKVVGEDKEQLLIYQIAAHALPEYRHIGDVSKLTFYYLNDNIETSFIGKDKELEKLQQKIIRTIDGIHRQDFEAKPGAFACKYCDYKDICNERMV